MRGMDPRRLVLLSEFAERRSITATATVLHLTPSAVSQQLKALEKEAGAPLMEPRGRGLELTALGTALADTAVEIRTALARARAVADEHVLGVAGTVRVAMFPSSAELLLPGAMSMLRERTPSLLIDPVILDAQESEFARLVPDFDIVLAHNVSGAGAWMSPSISTQLLLTEPLDVAVAPDHPLAERDEVSAAELADESWISVPHDFPFEHAFTRLERLMEQPLTVVARLPDLRTIEALIATGHGIGLVSRFTVAADKVRTLRLAEFQPTRQIYALTRAEHASSPAVRRVLDVLVEAGWEVERAVADGAAQ